MEARLLERLDKLEENLGKGFTDRFGLLDAEDDDIERRLNFTMAALTEKVDKSVKDIVRIDSSVNILSSSSLMVSQSAKDALAGFSEMSKKLFGFDTAAEALEKRIDEKFLSVREADCRDYARQQKRPFRDLAAELSERDVSEVTKKLASNIASSVETAGNIFFSRNCGKLYIIVDGKLPTNQAGFVTRLAEHLDGEEL
jgi:hypothetical protein